MEERVHNSFYPSESCTEVYQYLYNGKELTSNYDFNNDGTSDIELGWLDFNFRMYDPSIGRFGTLDPMAVFTPGISPYTYADDNPVNNVDYYGLGKEERIKRRMERQNRRRIRKAHRDAKPEGKGNKYNPNFITYGPHEPRSASGGGIPYAAPLILGPPAGNYELITSNENIPMLEVKIPDPLPLEHNIYDLPIPQYRDKDFPAAISVDLPFEINSYELDEDKAGKLLSDLIKSLQDYPQLQILIMVNTADGYHVPGKLYGSSKEVLDQHGIRELMNNRANAIYQYLIRKGVNPSQLKYGPGKHYDDPSKRKAVFDRR